MRMLTLNDKHVVAERRDIGYINNMIFQSLHNCQSFGAFLHVAFQHEASSTSLSGHQITILSQERSACVKRWHVKLCENMHKPRLHLFLLLNTVRTPARNLQSVPFVVLTCSSCGSAN